MNFDTTPRSAEWPKIVIIGAGFSGAATAINLLRRYGDKPLHITLINRHPDLGRGLAYGTRSPSHLLNVPAGRMSLFPDDDDDFLRFSRAIDSTITGSDFVPRSLYGQYLGTRLKDAISAAPVAKLMNITGEVVDLQIITDVHRAKLILANGDHIEADRVVLTTGNYAPADPPIPDKGFFNSPLYIRDPWSTGALEKVHPVKPILLIGTGLTMVDVALELARNGFTGQLLALSRRGLFPQAHRELTGIPQVPQVVIDMLRNSPPNVCRYLRVLRLCIENLPTTDWRDIIGALRPITAELWQALSIDEKSRFLRHLQPYWDTHRHRMAPATAQQLETLRNTGRLVMSSGRLFRLKSVEDRVQVTWRPRGSDANAKWEVGTVINCTGPQTQLKRVPDRLVQSLLSRRLIQPDALGLGVETDAFDALVHKDGKSSQVIFYTGPLLRAHYWECTAVPELRAAATRLADQLIISMVSTTIQS